MIGPARKKPLINQFSQPSRNYRQESSPTKASILLRADTSDYVNSLNARKENYSTALELHKACYDNELPPKCLKHLNFISLYCADEHKLLCVNCLYGSTAHKNHSVTPSNSSIGQIRRDNQINIRALDQEIKGIKDSQIKVNQNKKVIQMENHYILQEVAKEFADMRKMLDAKEKQVKQKIISQFGRASQQNEITRREIGWWRQQMLKIKSGLPRDGIAEDAQIYKHLVLELMLHDRLQTSKLTYVPSKDEMENQFLADVRDLRQVIKTKVNESGRGNQLHLF